MNITTPVDCTNRRIFLAQTENQAYYLNRFANAILGHYPYTLYLHFVMTLLMSTH